MSPELTKLLETFNLDNYANLEQLTLADWYTQFIYRLLVGSDYLSYEKAIPQLLNSPLRPQGLFTSLVDARDLTIAEDENDYPDEIDGIRLVGIKRMEHLLLKFRLLEFSNKFIPLGNPVFEVNLSVDNDQIIKEFKQYLKALRVDKKGTGNLSIDGNKKSWIKHKILPYIDICLMALSLDKTCTKSPLGQLNLESVNDHIGYKELSYFLFEEEIINKEIQVDGQKIRTTCRPIAESILDPHYLGRIRSNAINRKETHFIKGYDKTWGNSLFKADLLSLRLDEA